MWCGEFNTLTAVTLWCISESPIYLGDVVVSFEIYYTVLRMGVRGEISASATMYTSGAHALQLLNSASFTIGTLWLRCHLYCAIRGVIYENFYLHLDRTSSAIVWYTVVSTMALSLYMDRLVFPQPVFL